MHNRSTSARRHWLPLGLAAALTACRADEVDPRSLVRDPAPRPQSVAQAPRVTLVTADVLPMQPPSAPVFESAVRHASIAVPPQRAAIGHYAAAHVDDPFRRALATASPGLGLDSAPCGDREAIDLLLLGRAPFALIGGSLSGRETGAGLRQQALGVELFALTAPPGSSLRSLTRSQVRQIFTGEVADWQQLGLGRGRIVAVAPSDPALAERAARALMPGDAFATSCIRVASERHVADQLLQNPGAIGIVRLTAEPLVSGQKLLQIDWTTPSVEAFQYGAYPFGIALQLVTSGQPNDGARAVAEFARSESGRALLGRSLLPLP